MAEQFSIVLNDSNWKVRLLDRKPKAEGEEVEACCSAEKKTIWIHRNCREPERREFFIHEVLHALLWNMDEEWIELAAEQMNDALTAFEERTN